MTTPTVPTSTWLRRRHIAIAVGALALTAVVVFGFGPYHDLAANAPDGELLDTLPRPDVSAFLAELGPAGRSQYGTVLALDTIFTLVHGVFLWVLLRFPLQRLHAVLAHLAWLAIAATLCDLGENACIARLLLDPEAGGSWMLVQLTTAKFAVLIAAGGVLCLAWPALACVRLRRRA